MANLTVSNPYRKAGGRVIMRVASDPGMFDVPFTFVPAASYTSGGDTIATADMPSGYTTLVTPWAGVGSGPYAFYLDVPNKKLKVYVDNGAATAVEFAGNLQTVMGTAAITIFFRCC